MIGRMTTIQCPTCGQNFDMQLAEAMPFCSVQCQQIDLGRWLNEEISLPVVPDEDWEEEMTEG